MSTPIYEYMFATYVQPGAYGYATALHNIDDIDRLGCLIAIHGMDEEAEALEFLRRLLGMFFAS